MLISLSIGGFLKANIWTILIIIGLVLMVALIIRSMVKDKKAGKSVVCTGDCSKCHGSCTHSQGK